LIHDLVGSAIAGIAFRRFENVLPRLSKRDADRVAKVCELMLAEPEPMLSAMEGERKVMIASADQLLDPEIYNAGQPAAPNKDPLEDKQKESLLKFIKTMTPSERAKATQMIVDRATAGCTRVMDILRGPEANWLSLEEPPPTPPSEITTLDQAITVMSESITPIYRQVVLVALRTRTQIRLLRLHAKVISFRWSNDRLPDSLAEAVDSGDLADPVSGKPFVFEVRGPDQYRLYSRGVPGLGEIDLYYKRAPLDDSSGSDDKPPPDYSCP
jgi:hypothetical protein